MRGNLNLLSEMKGHPVTAHRQLLLHLIRNAHDHIDAKELYRRGANEEESISLSTVYRNLQVFKKLGLVEERRLGQMRCYYEIKQKPEHHHLVCQRCGKIVDFESPLIRKLMDEVQHQHGFNVTKK